MKLVRTLLEGLQEVQNPITFWAFLSVVGLAAVYIFLRSPKFHGLWSELLGRTLFAEQMFRLAKYVVIGTFLLLVMIVIAALAAPLILARMELDSEVEAIAISSNETEASRRAFKDALKVFKEEKDYSRALVLLTGVRPSLKSENSRETVDGLITASYYGSGMHREGLAEICQLYNTKPKTSIRYRFEIHAHTRKIAINEGFEVAEEVATRLQSTCGRKDFSPVWAGIPLAKMEYLKRGSTVFEEHFSLSKEDQRYLRDVITNYPDDAFLDHAHYFLFEFDEVIGTGSIIEDIAILSSAQLLRRSHLVGQPYTSLLKMYLEKFQRSDRYASIEFELTSSLLSSGLLAEGLELASKQGRGVGQYTPSISEGFTKSVRKTGLYESLRLAKEYETEGIFESAWYEGGVWGFLEFHDLRLVLEAFDSTDLIHYVRPSFGDLWNEYCDGRGIQLIRSNSYGEALDQYMDQKAALSDYGILVPGLLARRIRDLEGLMRADERDEPQARIDAAIYLREFGAESLALDRFQAIANDYGNPAEGQRALYLAGAMLRRMGRYDEAREWFYRLWELYPGGSLADDALAEVGWYHLMIVEEIEEAHGYFNSVLESYPDSNAADNALNWIAWSNSREGNYPEALARYLELSRSYAGTRLGDRAIGIVERVRKIVESARIEKRVVGVSVYGNRITEVDSGVEAVRYGDRIVEVNGYSVTDRSTLRSALNTVAGDSATVKVVRGTSETRLTFDLPVEEVTVYEEYLRN